MVANLFEVANRLQGQSIETEAQASDIYEAQHAFSKTALEIIDFVDAGSGAAVPQPIADQIEQFVAFRTAVLDSGRAFDDPDFFTEQQEEYYRNLHINDAISDEHKLGFELLAGLVRYQLNAELTLRFAQHLEIDGAKDILERAQAEPDFFKRLAFLSDELVSVIDQITARYKDVGADEQSFWEASASYLEENPKFEKLAKSTVSIQHIPNQIGIMGVAQFLHWNGYGGQSKIYERNTRLAPLSVQAIAYHGDSSGASEHQNFAGRMGIFGAAVGNVKSFGARAAANAMKERSGPVKIYGSGVGPGFAYENQIIQQLVEAGKAVRVTVSDCDGSSLKTLFKAKANPDSPVEEVRYEDMNGGYVHKDDEYSAYDLATIAIALHQVAPQRQAAVIRDRVHKVAPGGRISIPDANENVHWQFPLIPINVTDREGHPSPDMLFYFKSFAVPSQKPGMFKVAYPVRNETICTRDGLGVKHDQETGLYDHTMFVVLELSETELNALQDDWDNQRFDRADAMVSRIAPEVSLG